ncbi:uncharacterized protein K452DRAFT_254038 [Aplosporella prunicola CBS 121167]|uniref:Sec39 domain-containing protein n=1 Tax=Aplosporella prunicola CBS 121167 TaxID=1176127 RepID=A0A6A6B7I0_9PEZI|nr:uncharacterized protein K452DRAFT_254038 [Aplosporella prunicola CBS 121167]KAF2139568.1 hypothetical protein K452DRAFT_254038 [Aplosporella prunicola CBS 121167]
MDASESLSAAHCVLLATRYAAESNIDALRSLTLERPDAFDPKLILRIILSFLPESTEPSIYATYAQEVATRLYLEQRAKVPVDPTPVKDLSNAQADKRVRKLELLPLAHSSCPEKDADLDILTLFLIHRAYRIDAETGLLALIPPLVDPFLDEHEYLRTWFVSTVLPLLRLDFEYYPQCGATTSLEKFGNIHGAKGVELLLEKAKSSQNSVSQEESDSGESALARDMKGVVGPWMYGYGQRKRRNYHDSRRSSADALTHDQNSKPGDLKDRHDWEYVLSWMVHSASDHFDLISNAIEHWDGPNDVDLGGYANVNKVYGEELQDHLRLRYCQAAFGSVYAVNEHTRATIEAAHGVLVRLAQIMDFDPPPDLASSLDMLPKIEDHANLLEDSDTAVLQPDVLMKENNALTIPKLETFALLQIFVYSAYLLADLGYPISLNGVAKFRFHAEESDQLKVAQKILHGIANGPQKNDKNKWEATRDKLLWLWHWGMDAADEHALFGSGIFGKIDRQVFEREIINAFLTSFQFQLIQEVYLPKSGQRDHLDAEDVEEVVHKHVMEHYDNATNGNVTRGRMQKAMDIMTEFQPYFSHSPEFLRTEALLAATHSLSFYSLTLQHGVPFKPVNIRISDDPIGLIGKVLDQNLRSYTKLDDLINIAQNLVSARILERCGPVFDQSDADQEEQMKMAQRRVIGMAVEAALAEDDFETAYSFVINRLNPSFDSVIPKEESERLGKGGPATATTLIQRKKADDVSWRAAYLAGRHRSPNTSLTSSYNAANVQGSPALRRLDQRMELLSQALLLAPPSALPEVLTAWRRCEEEMTALLAQETEAEERFNDQADRRVPGAFSNQAITIQPRREVGRGAAEEAPMGLFDVARGAAAAFSRTAFPLRGSSGENESARVSQEHTRTFSMAGSETGSVGAAGSGEDGDRVRKRDMVANAVTGGLASGIGWVLGAQPTNQQREEK